MLRLANFSSQAVTVSISNTAEPEQKLAPQQSSGTLAIAPGSCTITVKRNGRTLASETQSVEADGGYSAYYWEPRQGQGKVLILHNNEKMKMRGTGSSAM
ncbi:MAG TPA: hypothetical protein VEX38_10210, partial [Fimbriimonadaceae bacterium]|nr:hypothetical protein [Fimbriimonadaceae bacterium]